MSGRPVVVLDLDGVIVKSNFLKHRAMLSMFAEYSGKQDAISDYILGNGGVSRRDKLVEILETIIGIKATQERLAHYLDRYAKCLEAGLAAAQLVEGVKGFITQGDHIFYVSSTAPEEEVREQLLRNALLHRFAEVYGSHIPKVEALLKIVERHPREELVFFGDSLGDLRAAREAGVAFVGVTNERDNFEGLEVVKLENFESLRSVDRAMRAALLMRSGAPARG